jgi:nucleotide-binding universal stress UspA family protein
LIESKVKCGDGVQFGLERKVDMFSHIMVPVDLAEKQQWQRAIGIACDMAQRHGARVTLVSVSGGLQGKVSHWHEEYGRRLREFAQEVSALHGVPVDGVNYGVPDPSVEVDQKLMQAINDLDVDLVVTASHQPGWIEYLVNSHSGKLARHAPVSVFVVRDTPAAN